MGFWDRFRRGARVARSEYVGTRSAAAERNDSRGDTTGWQRRLGVWERTGDGLLTPVRTPDVWSKLRMVTLYRMATGANSGSLSDDGIVRLMSVLYGGEVLSRTHCRLLSNWFTDLRELEGRRPPAMIVAAYEVFNMAALSLRTAPNEFPLSPESEHTRNAYWRRAAEFILDATGGHRAIGEYRVLDRQFMHDGEVVHDLRQRSSTAYAPLLHLILFSREVAGKPNLDLRTLEVPSATLYGFGAASDLMSEECATFLKHIGYFDGGSFHVEMWQLSVMAAMAEYEKTILHDEAYREIVLEAVEYTESL